jgi:parvulin-like peptidyl-prolyl isomerase
VIRSLLRPRRLVALALASLALGACSDVSGAPAARVGGVDISHEQLQADIPAFEFLTGLSGATCGTPVDGESEDAACARFVLANEIQEEIVKAYAVAHDLVADPADVDAAIAQLEQNLGGPEALDTQLEDAGLAREDLVAIAERLILFGAVQDAVAAERIDEASLRALYESALPQFTTVEVAHILLADPAEAEEVAAEATPENFAKLARQRSTDQASATAGGSLGSYSEAQFRQQFDPTFVEAALALEPGEISDVVQTQFGYHVIELIRRDVPTFEQVRDQLSAQQAPQTFQVWLQERYAALDVDVNPRYGRLDDETGEILAIRSTGDEPVASGPSGATAPPP